MQSAASIFLSDLVDARPNIPVRFSCRGCGVSLEVPASHVIRQLQRLGLGDEQTDVRGAATVAERPCHRCGGMSWETRPASPLPVKRPSRDEGGLRTDQ